MEHVFYNAVATLADALIDRRTRNAQEAES
jgi:hypothetical protein